MSGVSIIRRARERRGIGVRELARRANVTPGAVTQWEQSELRGTIRQKTLRQALRAMNTSLEAEIPDQKPGPLERREDRVALELHREVAKKLIEHPSLILHHAHANLGSLSERIRGDAAIEDLSRWRQLISDGRLGPLIDVFLGADQQSINMRQTSPFAGVLTQQERREAIERATN